MSDQKLIDALREIADKAVDDLQEAVAVACPAGSDQHAPTQHRDRKPPWCNSCGRDWRGVLQHEATP